MAVDTSDCCKQRLQKTKECPEIQNQKPANLQYLQDLYRNSRQQLSRTYPRPKSSSCILRTTTRFPNSCQKKSTSNADAIHKAPNPNSHTKSPTTPQFRSSNKGRPRRCCSSHRMVSKLDGFCRNQITSTTGICRGSAAARIRTAKCEIREECAENGLKVR